MIKRESASWKRHNIDRSSPGNGPGSGGRTVFVPRHPVLFIGFALLLSLSSTNLAVCSTVFTPPTQLTSATAGNHQDVPRIAVDSNGFSHVVWEGKHPTEGGPCQTWYADNVSGSWSTTQLTSATGANDQFDPEIAVDSNGFSHVTWYGMYPTEDGPFQTWYADNVSGSWSTTQLTFAESGNYNQFDPKIALDSSGFSHITWHGTDPVEGGTFQIWYADNVSGDWSITQLTAADYESDHNQLSSRIAVDSNGKSHVTWFGSDPLEGGTAQIWYVDNVSGDWSTTRLTSGDYPQGFPFIALDSNGFSHITWTEYIDLLMGGQALYADNVSGSWSTIQLTSAEGENYQARPRIALGPNGSSNVTWFGKHPTEGGAYQIWYSRSTAPEYLVIQSGDYTGDGISDIAIFRPGSGLWAVRGLGRTYFGKSGDIPASGDYDGDGITDVSVFRPSTGLWAVKDLTRVYFGDDNDLPVPGDYGGDGTCDFAQFDDGVWSVRNLTRIYYGSAGDLPVPGDYRGDGGADIAVFRPSSGLWAIRGISRAYFGATGDRPAPGVFRWYGSTPSYGAPPFRSGIGIFRPSSGLWAIRGWTRYYFGASSDSPLLGNFTGGSLDDTGIFRPSSGLWAVRGITRTYFGSTGDIPVTR